MPDQISLFNEMEAACEPGAAEPAADDALPKKRRSTPHRRGGKPAIDYDKFKTVLIDHKVPEAARLRRVRLQAGRHGLRGHQAHQDRPRRGRRRGVPPPRLQVRRVLRRQRQRR